ncbi:hypothetical protein D3C78_1704500 [compost metagenome]
MKAYLPAHLENTQTASLNRVIMGGNSDLQFRFDSLGLYIAKCLHLLALDLNRRVDNHPDRKPAFDPKYGFGLACLCSHQ